MQTKLIDIPATQPSSAVTSSKPSSDTVINPLQQANIAGKSVDAQLLDRLHLVATIDALGDCV